MRRLHAALALRRPGGVIKTTRAPVSAGTGQATVGWEAPLLDGDGGTLSDLANYKAYLGTAPGVYTSNSGLLSTSTFSYTFTGLANGVPVYVTVVAVDSSGNESPFSTEATFTPA